MITSHYTTNKIHSTSPEAFSLYEKSRLGEKKNNKIEYSLLEALYLISQNKMSLVANKKNLAEEEFIKKARKADKRIEIKFPVYKDMRNKGYILKTALKFGADFRVYKKGVKPGEDHSLWILYAVKESESHSWYDFAAKNRVAHSTKKNLLIGIVDDEDDVTYYEIRWMKP